MSTFSPSASTGMTRHVLAREQLPLFEVECRTADELIGRGLVPAPTLMKIDVEGWEYQVLNGAHQLLRSTCVKAFALEARSDPRGGLQDDRVAGLLNQYGYSLSHIPRPNGELHGVENYLAVRQ